MNVRLFTGFLPRDGEEAYAPRTAEHGPLPRLVFEVVIRDSKGAEYPEKCVIEDPALIAKATGLCTAGRAVIVQGEGTAREYHERGVLKGYVRETRVLGIEFPDRGGRKAET